MNRNILGCNIDFRAYENAFEAVEKELENDLLLSGVSDITGVPASTVQNWVKRGYTANPSGKKYAAEQTAEIILLNNMKSSIELPQAAALIKKTKKKSGVAAVDLLSVLASSIVRAKRFNQTDRDSLHSVINIELREKGINDRAVASLIMIIALSALSADYKKLANEEMNSL